MAVAKIVGAKPALKKLDKVATEYAHRIEAAAFVVASAVITEAMAAAPVQSGRLRRSRYVTRTAPVQAGFGAPYSAVVHEVGKHRKFLSRAFAAEAPRAQADIAQAVKKLAPGTTLATVAAVHPTQPHDGGSASTRRQRPSGPSRRAR